MTKPPATAITVLPTRSPGSPAGAWSSSGCLSDNGSAYNSFLWRDTCAELNIKVKKTRPYRPQTNEKIERFHRTLPAGWASKKFYTPRQPAEPL